MVEWGTRRRRETRDGRQVRPLPVKLVSRLPSLVSCLLLFIACTAITVRPTYRPFPLATFDTVTAKPPDIVTGAAEEVVRLGFAVRALTPAEGYLETRWFDLRTRRSRSEVRAPDHTVRIRVWVDLVTPAQSQVVIETVRRRSLDPSLPVREGEVVVAAGTPGDSLTTALRALIKRRFP